MQAQNIQISAESSTGDDSPHEFTVAGHNIYITNSLINYEPGVVAADVSHSGLAVALSSNGISTFDVKGKKVYQVSYKLSSDDESNKLYLAESGEFVLRENIANFLFYDSMGKIRHSISNSSQSSEGESISQFAADPAFKTKILYNPQIIMGGKEGSRARLVRANGTTRDFYNSQNRAIRFVKVSDNGQFIGVISYSSGSDDEIYITDRFGNEINTIKFDQNVSGIRFSEDGRFLTVYSNSRAAAYNVQNGERVGSASFRTPLKLARYFPEDNIIFALTADETASVLSNVEVHIIDIAARKIERESYSENLGITELIEPELNREKRYQYSLSGLSKKLKITASL